MICKALQRLLTLFARAQRLITSLAEAAGFPGEAPSKAPNTILSYHVYVLCHVEAFAAYLCGNRVPAIPQSER